MLVNGFKSKAAALRHLRDAGHPIAGLLTAPLHLAPFNLSGFQVCPQASQGCAAACLHTAGNPAYMAQKDASRKAKTVAYFKERDAFMAVLFFEIQSLERKAIALGMNAGVRLNATSDLPWERRKVTLSHNGQEWVEGIMDAFPSVQFYDYTKVTKRAITWAEGKMPGNYHLTFSKNEDNDADVARVLEAGGNVTVVMTRSLYQAVAKGGNRMAHWGKPTAVIDGDAHDYRPADPVGCIVALKAKGDAKADTSGFVLR